MTNDANYKRGKLHHSPWHSDIRTFNQLNTHSSWNVENVKGISCSCWKWDSAITSTIYESLASSTVFTACFLHWWGCLSRNWYAKIPELSTSWCTILQSIQANTLVDPGGFPLWPAINWSHSSLCTLAVHYIVSQPPATAIWSYLHPIACCFLFLLCPVLRTAFKCALWVILLVATIAASRWTKWYLRCCCISAGGALDEVPVVQLDSDAIELGWGVCVAMTCCCRKVRKMIMKRSGKSWGIYRYLQVKIESVTTNLLVLFKMNPAAYSCRLQGTPTVPRFAVSRTAVVCFFTGIYWGKRQQKSHVWKI